MIGEGVGVRHTYKAYASGDYVSNAKAVSATDPAVTGGQILRRTTSSLAYNKASYRSNEARTSRMPVDMRHGVESCSGAIAGELSCLTYFDLFEAVLRGTRVSPVSLSNTDFTSVAADLTTGTFTFTSGDPLALGMRVGHIYRFASLSDADNNARNFVALGFSGTSNRIMAAYPAPDTMGADTAFTMTSTGKHVIAPLSSHVSRKFAIERYFTELDLHELFTECRFAGFNLNVPGTGLATIDFQVLGRSYEPDSAGSSPFFTAPTAVTSTGLLASVNGLVRLEGANLGLVTSLSMAFSNGAYLPDPVVGQNFLPDIPYGKYSLTGNMSLYFDSLTQLNLFRNETECELIVYLTATSAINSPAITFTVPRIKFQSGAPSVNADGSVLVPMTYEGLENTVVGTLPPGMEATLLMVTDSEIV